MSNQFRKRLFEKNFSIQQVWHNSATLVGELAGLEEKCLPFQMCHANSYQYFSEALNNPENINLILKYKDRVVGFLLAKKYSQAHKELINHDPDLRREKENCLFIETIQIHPQFRKKGGFNRLVGKFLSVIRKEKICNFCLYARRKNSFSCFLQKRFGAKKIRTVENWLGFGEAFDYLEISVDRGFLDKLKKFFQAP